MHASASLRLIVGALFGLLTVFATPLALAQEHAKHGGEASLAGITAHDGFALGVA